MKQYKRSKRVGDQMRKEMSIVIDNAVSGRSLPMISVTDVSISDDLKYAKVYISALGDDDARETALSFLHDNKKQLRAGLARRIRIKFMPDISFAYDESIEQGMRIEKILSGLDELKKPTAESEQPEQPEQSDKSQQSAQEEADN